jgi:hypothetical protein
LNSLAIISNTSTPALSTTVALTSTNAGPDGLAAVLNPSGDVYVYIAKDAAGTGNAGVDIVDVTTPVTSSTVLSSSVAFANLTQIPAGVGVTPDGAEVFVALTDFAVPASYVWVVDNTNPPVSRSGSPFNLPDPSIAATFTSPNGITIPPLSPTPASGFYIYIGQSGKFNVDVLQENPPPPATNKPLHSTAISLSGGSPAPQGIANIPLPAVPLNLP